MASAAAPHKSRAEEKPEGRNLSEAAPLLFNPLVQVNNQQDIPPSINSAEPLVGCNMEDFAIPLMGPNIGNQAAQFSVSPLTAASAFSVTDLYQALAELLDRGLSQTATKITGELKADFQNLGTRIEAIENKLDQTVAATHQNSEHIQTVQEQLDVALSRIDELENRSKRYNIRIRGLPESITDIPAAVQNVIQGLIPNIPQNRLELDRAHRALGPPRKDGLPRDIIAKPHFYAVKDEVMRLARSVPNVLCQGHPVQIYADLSPSTMQRRRSLKPLLLVLAQKDIKYKWAFPFAVKFSEKGKNYSFSTFPDGERLLLRLKLISQEPAMDSSSSIPNTSKRPTPTSPQSLLWTRSKSKKARDGGPI